LTILNLTLIYLSYLVLARVKRETSVNLVQPPLL